MINIFILSLTFLTVSNTYAVLPDDPKAETQSRTAQLARWIRSKGAGIFLPKTPNELPIPESVSQIQANIKYAEFKLESLKTQAADTSRQIQRATTRQRLLQNKQVEKLNQLNEARKQLFICTAKGKVLEGEINTFNKAYQDKLAISWLRKTKRNLNSQWIFLALGNSEVEWPDKQDESYENHRSRVHYLVSQLVNRQYKILYDADSTLAETIATSAGIGNSIGITGNPIQRCKDRYPTLSISNPFLRLEEILRSTKIILTPDSILGMGLILEGVVSDSNKFLIWNESKSWSSSLWEWHKPKQVLKTETFNPFHWNSEPRSYYVTVSTGNLGITYHESGLPRVSQDVIGLLRHLPGKLSEADSAFDKDDTIPTPSVQAMTEDSESLSEASEFAIEYKAAFDQMSPPDVPDRISEGIAFFGSSRGNKELEGIVKRTVKKYSDQNVPFVTGGAGGFMELANMVAKSEGANSIGVPLSTLASESFEARNHTLTIPVSSYAVRIPLILGERNIILVAPGGMGTMKELATTFCKMASSSAIRPRIVLIGKNYYSELLQWIQGNDLPTSVKNQVIITKQ